MGERYQIELRGNQELIIISTWNGETKRQINKVKVKEPFTEVNFKLEDEPQDRRIWFTVRYDELKKMMRWIEKQIETKNAPGSQD